jgi:hypothetical protein
MNEFRRLFVAGGPMKHISARVLGALIALLVLSGARCQPPPVSPNWEDQERLERGHYG